MNIKEALFAKSSTKIDECPAADLPEYAFIGRSNVGKSSLINMLTGKRNLAKVSSKPGKTRLINHFLIDKQWYLVDLPGYGWAKVSKKEQSLWTQMIDDYFFYRSTLTCVFVLIDSRLEPQKIDLEFIQKLGLNAVPFVLVFTKADKLGVNKSAAQVARFKKEMKKNWEELPPIFLTSSEKGIGKDELLKYIININKEITR